MEVLHFYILQCLLITLYRGVVTGQLTAPLSTCPGDPFTFECTVTGNISGFTIWRVGGSIECGLLHRSTSSSRCGAGDAFIARPGTGFGPGTKSSFFNSTLSGTATSALNGTLVECFGPDDNVDKGNRVDISTLRIRGPPSVPNLFCDDLSGDVIGSVNVTVSWTLSDGDSADFYLINITSSASQTPYGGLLNITNASVTQYELTGFMTGYEYNITVRGVNCRSQEESESDSLTIAPQVSAITASTICAVYDEGTEALQIIENTWNEVDNVTVSEDCTNGQDIRASYELSYHTDSGTLNTTCVVDGTECSNGTCHHELQNNTVDSRCQPPVSQFSGEGVTVSLTARNIVGRSNSAVSRSISGRNIDLEVHIDATNLSSAFMECTFYQPGYSCTIDYGTDPSYTNLVYRGTSYTQGRTATIKLSQRLSEETIYYYIVSAESSSQCVRVREKFRAGCNEGDLADQDQTLNTSRCADRGFVNSSSIPDGVVCYNGTTAGSRAVYICNNDFILMGNEVRVCQSDGNWNGSIPRCFSEESDRIVGDIVASVVGGVSVVSIIVSIMTVVKALMYKKRSKNLEELLRGEGMQQESFSLLGTGNSLLMAARQGNLDEVKFHVEGGADVNIKDNDGISQNTDDYFFIQSTGGFEMVMDVEHSNPDPGTPVISYCRNDPELVYNQLWMKEHIGEGEFYLVSKLSPDCKLTIQNEVAVVDTTGTLFKEMKSDGESVILILSGTDQALQVNDGYSCTPIMAVRKDEDSNKQKWILKNHNAK